MDAERIKQLLEAVKSGRTGVEEAMEQLKSLPYQDLGFVKVDTHRSLRKGFPEVVFCPGKSPEQIKEILLNLTAVNPVVLAMRATEQV
ncbi:MAG TPA: 1-(5-phosphoribosyl)-5-amino-4-imidazole-carboxylate carboxylase, partial [Firmicutes bacterium]|nr:1-(5-phosphoribosyl)-5-amino-4-imidazole-carboxylate carboxylase [Bacillota bacterium]